MEPYSDLEITQMRIAFNGIETLYLIIGEDNIKEETRAHRRLNKTLIEELNQDVPDHEKIYYLLNAINNLQNEQQQTTAPFPAKEEPQSEEINRIKRWFQENGPKR